VQRDQARQVLGQLRPVLRLPPGEPRLRAPGVPHVDDAGDAGAVGAAIGHHARQRDAAEIDAVISPLARDEHDPPRLTAGTMISKRDLHSAFDRFRARIGEENAVQALRRQRGNRGGGAKGLGMAAREAGRVVQRHQLFPHRVGDFHTAMPGRASEQARASVEDRLILFAVIVRPFGPAEQLRLRAEVAVRGEGHPVMVEIGAHDPALKILLADDSQPTPNSSAAIGPERANRLDKARTGERMPLTEGRSGHGKT